MKLIVVSRIPKNVSGLGKLTFERRYNQNKNTKRYAYLLDETIGVNRYQRLGEILEGKILEFVNQLSFENAGKLAIDSETFSKQTVKNVVQNFAQKDDKIFEDLET